LPNIASVLKEEVARLVRKELRRETEGLKKSSTQYRSAIAELKRRVAALERQLSGLDKKVGRPAAAPAISEPDARLRFSAKGLRAQRKRLDLSAADMAALLGVSAQTIYNWEAEVTRPRPQQVAAIAALRGIGKTDARARLA
jgi:DNA-binding transcriptional regulator YiaG